MSRESLTDWLLETNSNGTATGVRWGRLGTFLGGSFLVTVAAGGAEIVLSFFDGAAAVFLGLGSFAAEFVAGIFGIPASAVSAAWKAPLAFVTSFELLSGPLGIALVVLVLVIVARWL